MHRKMIYGAVQQQQQQTKKKNDCALELRLRKPANMERKNEYGTTNNNNNNNVREKKIVVQYLRQHSTCTTIPDINRTTKKNDGPQ